MKKIDTRTQLKEIKQHMQKQIQKQTNKRLRRRELLAQSPCLPWVGSDVSSGDPKNMGPCLGCSESWLGLFSRDNTPPAFTLTAPYITWLVSSCHFLAAFELQKVTVCLLSLRVWVTVGWFVSDMSDRVPRPAGLCVSNLVWNALQGLNGISIGGCIDFCWSSDHLLESVLRLGSMKTATMLHNACWSFGALYFSVDWLFWFGVLFRSCYCPPGACPGDLPIARYAFMVFSHHCHS